MSAADGWRRLLASDLVGVAEVRAVDVDGRELVVWRGIDDVAVVMDARCPHLWSHLEAEGVVDACEIVCSSHFWRFDAAGRGTKVNVLGRRDPKADIRVHPSREHDGYIEAVLDGRLVEPPSDGPAPDGHEIPG